MELSHLGIQVKVKTLPAALGHFILCHFFFFLFQIQHFILNSVSFMPGVIRVEEGTVKLDLQVPSLIPPQQHSWSSGSCSA